MHKLVPDASSIFVDAVCLKFGKSRLKILVHVLRLNQPLGSKQINLISKCLVPILALV